VAREGQVVQELRVVEPVVREQKGVGKAAQARKVVENEKEKEKEKG